MIFLCFSFWGGWKGAFNMKRLSFALLLLILIGQAKAQPYKDSKLPVEVRVKDLLSRMTPEEKFWQMFMIPGDLSQDKEKYKTGIFGFQVSTVGQNAEAAGQMLSYAAGASAVETAEMVNEMQHFFIEDTHLGIPIIPFDEALHGLVRARSNGIPAVNCFGCHLGYSTYAQGFKSDCHRM